MPLRLRPGITTHIPPDHSASARLSHMTKATSPGEEMHSSLSSGCFCRNI